MIRFGSLGAVGPACVTRHNVHVTPGVAGRCHPVNAARTVGS
jgi:hypothetical protein